MSTEASSEPIRLGIIGLEEHDDWSPLDYLVERPDICTITALADNNSKVLAQEERFDAFKTENWQEVAEHEAVDAVFFHLPPNRWRAVQLAACVAMGKHVFCEGPLARTWGEYDTVSAALSEAEPAGLVVSACQPRRFDSPYKLAKAYLEDPVRLLKDFKAFGNEEFGCVLDFNFNFRHPGPRSESAQRSLLQEHLHQEVDLMSYIFGFSDLSWVMKREDKATAYYVQGRREDGLAFSFAGGQLSKEGVYQEDMDIHFENNSYLRMNTRTGEAELQQRKGGSYTLVANRYKTDRAARLRAAVIHFLQSVQGVEAPHPSPDEMRLSALAAITLKHGGGAMGIYLE